MRSVCCPTYHNSTTTTVSTRTTDYLSSTTQCHTPLIFLCYAGHQSAGTLDTMKIHKLREELPVLSEDNMDVVMMDLDDETEDGIDLTAAVEVDTVVCCDEDEEIEPDDGDDDDVIRPRSKRCFYKTILAGVRIWQRPPLDVCSRCEEFAEVRQRRLDIQAALSAVRDGTEEEWSAHQEILASNGGQLRCREIVRELENDLIDLHEHVTWKHSQRRAVKLREEHLKEWELLIFLDYGGMTDSLGKKVNVWSATIVAKGHEQTHIDFFFDAANQNCQRPGFKKNGEAGIFFLDQLLNPVNCPQGREDQSWLNLLFPKATHVILSGDTGNGYRAYQMLQFLSTVFRWYSWEVELFPLAHARVKSNGRPHRSPECVPD